MHGATLEICTKLQTVPSYKCCESFRGINPMELGTDRKIVQSKTKKKHGIIIVNDVARNQDVIPSKLTQHAVYLYSCILLFI
jgi:ABC-type lipopolysaccharide export system ATPase subunit